MAKFDIHALVKSHTGPKLSMLMTGVGSYASGIIGIPGASAVVDRVIIPYSREAVVDLLKEGHPQGASVVETASAVSHEMVVALHLCNCKEGRQILPVTVTAAITTARYRRGDNHAYIAYGNLAWAEVYHLQLDKMDEADHDDLDKVVKKRYVQDRMVSEVAIAMATGIQSDLVDELQKGGFLVRC